MNEDGITLIRTRSDRDTAPEPWPQMPFEPAFFDPGTRLSPDLHTADRQRRYAEYLSFHVARWTKDLLSHVRRILVLAAAGNRNGTFSAISDLFQVLGSKGLELRRDMLNRVQDLLSPMQQTTLRTQLARRESVAAADLPTSRFAPKPSTRLITRKTSNPSG